MAAIGIVAHAERSSASDLAAATIDWLVERGHEVRLPGDDARQCERPAFAVRDDELIPGLDLMVGIGGDGTILRAVELAADDDVAVLGVNAGTLGYLSTIEPDGLRIALKRFLAGAHQIEERMRLKVEVLGAQRSDEPPLIGLNEMVLERADVGHTVRLAVSLGGERFTSYVADGIIVATATGSTAYAFSARGPIVEPTHRAMVLVPVSPHMLFDRSLVLGAATTIELTVEGHRSAHLSVDGRSGGVVREGEVVRCSAAARSARLVSFGHHDFHRTLREKFGLSDR